jgi:iron complex outermembrane recepter protein
MQSDFTSTFTLVAVLLGTSLLYAPPTRAADTAGTDSPPANSTAAPDQLGEVVVTARLREEKLLDIPVSVTAVSGAQVDNLGVTSVTGLISQVPSLYVAQNNSLGGVTQPINTYLVLRGVGSTSQIEPSVGIFIDGVYQTNLGFDFDFLEIERIEVLKGPQATLFGRNTEAGAISVVTKQPSEDFYANVQAEYASFDTERVRAFVNGALAPNLYGNFGIMLENSGGYITNLTTHDKEDASNREVARASVRYDGGPLQTTLTGDYTNRRSGSPPYGVNADYQVFDSDHRRDPYENEGGALKVSYDTSEVTTTSITGFRRTSTSDLADLDGGPVPDNIWILGQTQSLLSEELRFSSPKSDRAFGWTAGGYAFRQDDDFTQYVSFVNPVPDDTTAFRPGSMGDQDFDIIRHGISGFGELNYRVDKLELVVGGRYSHELSTMDANPNVTIPAFGLHFYFHDRVSAAFDDFSPNFSATYHIDDNAMVYATVAKGFKAGGFQRFDNTVSQLVPYRNEDAVNYETGLKGKALNGELEATLAVFYIDLKNQQLSSTPIIDGLPTNIISNAGKSHSEGFETESTWHAAQWLSFTESVSYTDAKFDQYVDSSGQNQAGKPLPGVPVWQGSLIGQASVPVGNDWVLGGLSRVRVVSPYDVGSGIGVSDPSLHIAGYQIIDLNTSLSRHQWKWTAFVDNVANRFTPINRVAVAATGAALGDAGYQVLPPRIIGIRVGYSW